MEPTDIVSAFLAGFTAGVVALVNALALTAQSHPVAALAIACVGTLSIATRRIHRRRR
ncbi:hypothetical protein EDF42_1531 [Curtobacterium sp. PhB172]|uniref:hypothetical protein n=1 Tax=unclassified Curtobacterium TaxID=257496 RepID=UPI000FA30C51|nr:MULTISPECIES: hypothetical protein [unclassified Curtobacterium]ROP64882.1 hypothetical protein EDF55_1534 [Curtobacterium sp. ZW137]ROS65110.1 hypothetical protein EDF42_1531 [Curtobacterium sp. PhB172]